MLLLYNLLQAAALPLVGPLGLLYAFLGTRYRSQLTGRLGRLPDISVLENRSPRIWMHALSVGEVNAAVPLAEAICRTWPNGGLICSATTATGLAALRTRLADTAHVITASPFDILPVVDRFVVSLNPDCFVLVETDIWPNWIWDLRRRSVPALLVNGAVSSRSADRLSCLGPLPAFLYAGFDVIAMQSGDDRDRLLATGVNPEDVQVLGNLKYDLEVPTLTEMERAVLRGELGLEPASRLWIAGSTHEGEEKTILAVHGALKTAFPDLQLLLAPRDPGRAPGVEALAQMAGLKAVRRSAGAQRGSSADVLILDTLGELLKCYGLAEVAFVGGSLVDVGGHNVLEPAAYGIPVLFGPYVESCSEASADLEACGGGVRVSGMDDMVETLMRLLASRQIRMEMGGRARGLVEAHRGAVGRHIRMIAKVLEKRDRV
jgi:3-deoxy-D-manno-octulosonic-acid transferase